MERIWNKHKQISLHDARDKNTTLKPKILVGMSGGVDSLMALLLLKKQGWQPIGVSLKYAVWQESRHQLRENVCCTALSLDLAKAACRKLKVPHFIFNVADDFKKKVIAYFIRELKRGRTPNPCIICNREIKFKKLFQFARNKGIKYVATGHYARIAKDKKTNQYQLLVASDKEKDQSYSLSWLPQKWLPYIVFPLGKLTKKEVFDLAKKEGFEFYLKRKQSQDFCFAPARCLKFFLEKEIGLKPGIIKDIQGRVLGEHQGLHFYTIGQRRGLKLTGGPYFVKGFDRVKNILIVTKNQEEISQKEIFLSPFHFISARPPAKKLLVLAKTRSRQPAKKATLFPLSQDKLKIVFAKPQLAVTPGQFCVFYQKEVCLGGGVII